MQIESCLAQARHAENIVYRIRIGTQTPPEVVGFIRGKSSFSGPAMGPNQLICVPRLHPSQIGLFRVFVMVILEREWLVRRAGITLEKYSRRCRSRTASMKTVSADVQVHMGRYWNTLSPSPQKKFLVRMFMKGYSVLSLTGGSWALCSQCSSHSLHALTPAMMSAGIVT